MEATEAKALVGRGAETRLISDLMDGAGVHGAALLLRGDPGIGKSALLVEAARYARQGRARVLTATGVEPAARLPFAGLHELLRPLLAGLDQLPEPQRDALQAAFGMVEGGTAEPFLIGLASLNLLADASASSPTLVVVDDAQWLDPSSADVLVFIARRLDSEPILLVAAIREGFASSLLEAALPERRLEPLDDADAGALLDAGAPALTAAVRETILAQAAGNPLALIELPRATESQLSGSLTARLERAFAARVPSLPPATRTLLVVAALNDSDSLPETLQATAELLDQPVGAQDLTPATAARLIDADEQRLRFRHPLIRSAIHQTSTIAERSAAHTALANILLSDRERSVWHEAASRSSPDENVANRLEEAAQTAQRRGGPVTAVSALERAAELSESPSLRTARLLRAAELAVELGQQELVNRLLREVDQDSLSLHERAQLIWINGRLDDGVHEGPTFTRSLIQLAAEVADTGDTALALKLLDRAALHSFWTANGPAVGDSVIACAERLPIDAQDARLLAIMAFANAIDRGAVVLDRLHRFPSVFIVDAPTARLLGAAALMVGDFHLARARYQSAIPELRTQGRFALLARALTALAWSAGHLADLATAIPAAEEGSSRSEEARLPVMRATARATDAMLAALQGDGDRAAMRADEAELGGVAVGARPVLAMVQHARGVAALGQGRHAEALDHLQRMHDPTDPAYHFAIRCSAVADLAEAAAYSGNTDRIRPIIDELEVVATKTPSPALQLGLRHARPLLAGDDEAERLFNEALHADTSRYPYARARAQLCYGAWLRRRRQTAASRAPLRAARDTFDALGVIPWSQRARQELRASGETSRRRTPDARDQLTAQELQIAQMAGEGLTNRDIGDKLYLSHRTVGAHLHRIFPKLGITSRIQLTAALEGTTLTSV